jgi:hypothetical protein
MGLVLHGRGINLHLQTFAGNVSEPRKLAPTPPDLRTSAAAQTFRNAAFARESWGTFRGILSIQRRVTTGFRLRDGRTLTT